MSHKFTHFHLRCYKILIQVLRWLVFLVTVYSFRSNGVKLDGTRLTVPNGTESVGPVPKLRGTGTEIMWADTKFMNLF